MCDSMDVSFFANSWLIKGLYKFVITPRQAYWCKWREQVQKNHFTLDTICFPLIKKKKKKYKL